MQPRQADQRHYKSTLTMSDKTNTNLWGGRFKGETDPAFAEFNSSFGFDRRLFAVDVQASMAHCDGLETAGVLTKSESEDRKSTRLNSSHGYISYAVFCLKKKT